MDAAVVLCGSKRSFCEEDQFLPSPLHRSKRLRCSSSRPPHRIREEQPEPDRFIKKAKLTTTNENPSNTLGGAEEWVELFVIEMSFATSVEDAKARAANALEVFAQRIRSPAAAGAELLAAAHKEEENTVLKQQIEEVKKENMILKRAVSVQNERLNEFEGRNRELEHVKQMVSEYKEQLSKLEVANYSLAMHLKQAQQCNNSIPLSFYPHDFRC